MTINFKVVIAAEEDRARRAKKNIDTQILALEIEKQETINKNKVLSQ